MESPSAISRREFIRLGSASLAATAVGTIALPVSAAPPSALPLTRQYEANLLHEWISTIYDAVRTERFSPPSAARAYGAVCVAAYESVVDGMPEHLRLGGQLNGLSALPSQRRPTRIHWPAALNAAVEQVAIEVFADRSESSRNTILEFASRKRAEIAASVTSGILSVSTAHGAMVGNHVARWIGSDGYAEILGLPFTPGTGPGLWERTPPNFGAPIEPHWERVRPFAIPSADFCAPEAPTEYSEEIGSPFWEQARVVYETSKALSDEQRTVALFWRDNPDGTTGLPSGHWMQIAGIASRTRSQNLAQAVETMALVGTSLADGFTSCWTEKYRRNVLRPVTYIRNLVDPNWASFVNSPAFPEYTSGHSVGSAAAAATLTHIFGDLSYIDDSGEGYGRPAFAYESFWHAANEAAISRLYGGIHYPMAIDAGLEQGRHVSSVVLARIQTRRGRG